MLVFLDPVSEQHLMNALFQQRGFGWMRHWIDAVQLRFDLSRMQRHQQDAISYDRGFRSRMCNKQHDELCILPQRQ